MATIIAKKDKQGVISSYKFMVCVGRDDLNKQIWRTCTVPRPDGLTPARERKEVERMADAWEQEQREEYERSRVKVDKTKITLASFIREHWLPDHVHDGKHSPSSVAFYENMAKGILQYFGEKKKLRSIDPETVKRYVRYLSTEATTKGGEPLSKTTVNRYYQTLRNIVRYAIRFGYMKDDPFQMLSTTDKPGNEKKDVDFLPPQAAAQFMSKLEGEPLFWQCFENLLITTGIRRGEAVGLQWGDIDAQNMTLNICRNVTLDSESENGLHIGLPKNKETRRVPISPRVMTLLTAFKAEQEENYHAAFMPTAFILCTPGDPYTPITPPAATRWQARFVRRHNLPKVSPHDLRHTAATLALESGATMKQVQHLLGHADPSTTLRFYSGVTDEAERRTVQGIESILASGN